MQDEDEGECLNAHSPSIGASANMRPPGHAHTGHPQSRPAAIALALHTATGLQLQLQVGRCRLQGQHRSGPGWQRQRQRGRWRRITSCGSNAGSQNTQDRLRKFWLRRVRRPWPNHVASQPGTQVDVEEQARHSLHAVLCIPRGSRAPVSS